MKPLRLFLFAFIASTLFLTPIKAQNIRNRYAMGLAEDGNGGYTIKNAQAYEKMIGRDPYRLPKALVPYKRPPVRIFEKAAAEMEKIVPETLVYKKNVAGEDLPMMVYRSGKSNSPVVFFIHGGGWVQGTYTASPNFCKALAGKYGITVVSIEYTFAGVSGARMEDTVQDCYDAVEYVLSRAGEFGIDPERIGFVGSSAGGHLSACCALHFPQTKALAGWYGAYDLPYTMSVYAPESRPDRHHLYDVYLNGWDPDYIEKYSPVKMAESTSGLSFKAILFVGTADITAGPDNAPRFKEALAKAGVKHVKVMTYPYVTHSIGLSYAGVEMFTKSLLLFAKAL